MTVTPAPARRRRTCSHPAPTPSRSTVTDNRGGTGDDRPTRSRSTPRRRRRQPTARPSSPTAPSSSGASASRAATPRPTRAARSTRARTSTATPSASRARCPSPTRRRSFNGTNGFASSNAVVQQPDRVLRGGLVQDHARTAAARSSASAGTATGSSNSYDRHVYMQDDGQLVFGTYTGQLNTITSPASYNDGQWHHVVATQSGNGMKLYVDGAARRHQPADRRPRTTPATGRSAATPRGARRATTSTAPSTRSRCT